MTGIKEVRKNNSQQFIDDFKSIHSFVVMTKYSSFFEVLKQDVWRAAKTQEIVYTINITFKSMTRHEIIHIPNETRKEKVESIILHAKALILPLSPRHPEQPPQPSTP